MEAQWVTVASTDDIGDGELLLVEAGGEEICLYNLGGTVYATENTCTHGQASLAEGFIEGDCIECPLHQGMFDIRTGKATQAPATEDLRVFPVQFKGNEIQVDIARES